MLSYERCLCVFSLDFQQAYLRWTETILDEHQAYLTSVCLNAMCCHARFDLHADTKSGGEVVPTTRIHACSYAVYEGVARNARDVTSGDAETE